MTGIKMRKYSLFCWLLASLVCLSCAHNKNEPSTFEVIDYNSRIGWVDGHCLAIQNNNLDIGSKITVVQLGEQKHRSAVKVAKIVAKVLGKATDGETCFPLLGDRRSVNVDSGYSFYQINSYENIGLAIAVTEEFLTSENYIFDYCATMEGISFSVKKTDQNIQEEIWNGYYYLAYDTETSC